MEYFTNELYRNDERESGREKKRCNSSIHLVVHLVESSLNPSSHGIRGFHGIETIPPSASFQFPLRATAESRL